MTPKALKVCATAGCPTLTSGSRCAEHAPEAWAGSTRASRLPSDWRKRRARILRRDPTCRLCGIAPSVEVDHIVAGDDHREHALQGVCKKCHAVKSQREAAAARAARRQDGER